MIREGLTNEEIAARLGISFAAAKYHVAEILSKLGVNSRHEAVKVAEAHRRGRFASVFGWVPARKTWQLAAIAMAVAAGIVAIAFLLVGPGTDRDSGQPVRVTEAAPDVDPRGKSSLDAAQLASPFPRTILIAPSEPQVPAESFQLIASLRRVGSLAELRDAMSQQINLIVVDQSAAAEVEGSDYLSQQVQLGRAILELNVCIDQVHGMVLGPIRPPADGVVTEISPTGEVRQYQVDPDDARRFTRCSRTSMWTAAVGGYFGLRRVRTADELAEAQGLGRGAGVEGFGRIQADMLRQAISRLDEDPSGNCDEARDQNKEELAFLCPPLNPPLPP